MAICLPFPDIAAHVVNTKPVSWEACDGRCLDPLILPFDLAPAAIDQTYIGFVMAYAIIIAFYAAHGGNILPFCF